MSNSFSQDTMGSQMINNSYNGSSLAQVNAAVDAMGVGTQWRNHIASTITTWQPTISKAENGYIVTFAGKHYIAQTMEEVMQHITACIVGQRIDR